MSFLLQASFSEGRVYFQGCLAQIDRILQLRSVERAFALICHKDAEKYKSKLYVKKIYFCVSTYHLITDILCTCIESF